MSARQSGPYDTIARKWLALAERRKAHLIELRDSGRWKHYFTEAELDGELREVNLARERFAKVAGLELQIGEAVPADRGRDVVPLSGRASISRFEAQLDSAIEAVLSAAAELQESTAKSAA